MLVDQELRTAELAFLNAPFQPDGWAAAMGHLARVSRTQIAQLVGVGGGAALPLNLLTEQPYDPHDHLRNPHLYGPSNWRINSLGPPLTLLHDPHYRAYRLQHRTEVYDDACSDLDLPHGCQTPLITDDGLFIGLALLRSSGEGSCDEEVLGRFGRIARQAQRTVRVQLALGQNAGEMMLEGLTGRSEATLLIDRFGGLAAMTPAAEKLFDHPNGLRLDGFRVRLADYRENGSFDEALGRLLKSDGVSGPVLHEARVGRCPHVPGGRWRLFAVRLPAVPHGFGFEPQLAVTLKPLAGKR